MQLVLSEIKGLGANLVVISPQLPGQSLSMAKNEKLQFEVLSDVGNKVARDFGLEFSLSEDLRPVYRQFGIDLEKINGDQSYELPIPATYIVDQTGIICHAFVDVDHTKRLEPSEIVEILRASLKFVK